MTEPLDANTVELLTWVSSRPRTYSDAMDAWKSNCPRLSVWDDALAGGLVSVARNPGGAREARVALTERGSALLAAAR